MDNVTRTRERQKLLVEMLERRIRQRARQLSEERGQIEGRETDNWVRAESEILKSNVLAPLWNKLLDLRLAETSDETVKK